MRTCLLISAFAVGTTLAAQSYIISTIAGTGNPGNSGDDGPAVDAELHYPNNLSLDASGNVYFIDTYHMNLRRIDVATGIITHIAGTNGPGGFSGDGGPPYSAAMFNPVNCSVDADTNIYIADNFNYRIRLITDSNNVIQTHTGVGAAGYNGPDVHRLNAIVDQPSGLALAVNGDLFFTQFGVNQQRIRYIDADSGYVHDVAGTGPAGFNGNGQDGLQTTLNSPTNCRFGPDDALYFCDVANNRVRRWDPVTHIITTVAGTGSLSYNGDGLPATEANLFYPDGLAFNAAGDLFIVESGGNRIRRVDHATGLISTIAGTGAGGYNGDDQPAASAQIHTPVGITADDQGNLYFCDAVNNRVRKLAPVAASVAETTASSARIHPVPAVDRVNVEWSGPYSGSFTLCDMSGRVVSSTAVQHAERLLLDLENAPCGSYALRRDDGLVVGKVMVVR